MLFVGNFIAFAATKGLFAERRGSTLLEWLELCGSATNVALSVTLRIGRLRVVGNVIFVFI